MFIYQILLGFHFLLTLVLVLVILIQTGKGADIGAVFGGGGAVFGSVGTTTLMHKLTIGLAAAFMTTSLVLAIIAPRQQDTIFKPVAETAAPVAAPLESVIPESTEASTASEINESASPAAPVAPAPSEEAEAAHSETPAPESTTK